MVLALRPRRGGFLRAFGCAEFIRDFLLGSGPYGSPTIDPKIGAPQADMFFQYKTALIKVSSEDKAARAEEKLARKQTRRISPDNIQNLTDRYIAESPYKTKGCRFHGFVVYFSTLRRLGWVEPSGYTEPSAFQDHYAPGQPRKYYRLTRAGTEAPEEAWRNPCKALYG
jgi:hypothetical protein